MGAPAPDEGHIGILDVARSGRSPEGAPHPAPSLTLPAGGGGLGRGQPHTSRAWARKAFVDRDLVGTPAGFPSITLDLHPQSGFGHATEHLLQPNRHLWRNTGVAV
jgi:hypothetical protein